MWITAANETNRPGSHHPGLRSFLLLLALLALPLCAAAVPQSLQDLAREADTAYKNGDFSRAVTLYRNILDTGYRSGELYYNLGNACYKSGQLGQAILMFERAARLMPHNRDVRYNLELARERAVDRIEPPPRLIFWTWLDTLRDIFPPRLIAVGAWGFTLLFAVSLAVTINIRRSNLHRMLRGITSALAILVLLNLSLVGLRSLADSGDDAAIIMTSKVTVRSAPDQTGKEVFALHEGTRVTLVQKLEGWAEIRLADGRQGWLPLNSFETI